jgi:hypothetical protein
MASDNSSISTPNISGATNISSITSAVVEEPKTITSSQGETNTSSVTSATVETPNISTGAKLKGDTTNNTSSSGTSSDFNYAATLPTLEKMIGETGYDETKIGVKNTNTISGSDSMSSKEDEGVFSNIFSKIGDVVSYGVTGFSTEELRKEVGNPNSKGTYFGNLFLGLSMTNGVGARLYKTGLNVVLATNFKIGIYSYALALALKQRKNEDEGSTTRLIIEEEARQNKIAQDLLALEKELQNSTDNETFNANLINYIKKYFESLKEYFSKARGIRNVANLLWGTNSYNRLKIANDEEVAQIGIDAFLIDNVWIKNVFIMPLRDIYKQPKMRHNNRNISPNIYYTKSTDKFYNTTVGKHQVINPKYQFTEYCDIRHSDGSVFDYNPVDLNPNNTLDNHRYPMGRYYTEAIDDNINKLHLSFGIIRYNNLFTYLSNTISPIDAYIIKTGNVPGNISLGIFNVVRVIGEMVGIYKIFIRAAFKWYTLLALGHGVAIGMGANRERTYYYMLKRMNLYLSCVKFIIMEFMLHLNFIEDQTPWFSSDEDLGGEHNSPSPTNIESYKFKLNRNNVEQINKIIPNLIDIDNGTINIYEYIGNFYRNKANLERRYLNLEKDINKRLWDFFYNNKFKSISSDLYQAHRTGKNFTYKDSYGGEILSYIAAFSAEIGKYSNSILIGLINKTIRSIYQLDTYGDNQLKIDKEAINYCTNTIILYYKTLIMKQLLTDGQINFYDKSKGLINNRYYNNEDNEDIIASRNLLKCIIYKTISIIGIGDQVLYTQFSTEQLENLGVNLMVSANKASNMSGYLKDSDGKNIAYVKDKNGKYTELTVSTENGKTVYRLNDEIVDDKTEKYYKIADVNMLDRRYISNYILQKTMFTIDDPNIKDEIYLDYNKMNAELLEQAIHSAIDNGKYYNVNSSSVEDKNYGKFLEKFSWKTSDIEYMLKQIDELVFNFIISAYTMRNDELKGITDKDYLDYIKEVANNEAYSKYTGMNSPSGIIKSDADLFGKLALDTLVEISQADYEKLAAYDVLTEETKENVANKKGINTTSDESKKDTSSSTTTNTEKNNTSYRINFAVALDYDNVIKQIESGKIFEYSNTSGGTTTTGKITVSSDEIISGNYNNQFTNFISNVSNRETINQFSNMLSTGTTVLNAINTLTKNTKIDTSKVGNNDYSTLGGYTGTSLANADSSTLTPEQEHLLFLKRTKIWDTYIAHVKHKNNMNVVQSGKGLSDQSVISDAGYNAALTDPILLELMNLEYCYKNKIPYNTGGADTYTQRNNVLDYPQYKNIKQEILNRKLDTSATYDDIDDVTLGLMGGFDTVAFQTDYMGVQSCSISNGVQSHEVESIFNDGSGIASKIVRNGGGMIASTLGITNLINKAITAGGEFVSGFTMGLSNVLAGLVYGGKLRMPKTWSDSSSDFGDRHQFRIQLRSPYGDSVSQFINLYIPLAFILAGALPMSIGSSAYGSPFLCSAFQKGVCDIQLGMITDVQIERNVGNMGMNDDRRPLGIDVILGITDLDSHASASVNLQAMYNLPATQIFNRDFTNRLSRFIQSMSGVEYYEVRDAATLVNKSKRFAKYNHNGMLYTGITDAMGKSESAWDGIKRLAGQDLREWGIGMLNGNLLGTFLGYGTIYG